MRESVSKLEWPKSGLADKLPKPDSQYGEIDFDEDDFSKLMWKKHLLMTTEAT